MNRTALPSYGPALVVALALAGCGSMTHPNQAAHTVHKEVPYITPMSTKQIHAYCWHGPGKSTHPGQCEYVLKQQGGLKHETKAEKAAFQAELERDKVEAQAKEAARERQAAHEAEWRSEGGASLSESLAIGMKAAGATPSQAACALANIREDYSLHEAEQIALGFLRKGGEALPETFMNDVRRCA